MKPTTCESTAKGGECIRRGKLKVNQWTNISTGYLRGNEKECGK